MNLTLLDRLLLRSAFTFRSSLSPIECAARIAARDDHQTSSERWICSTRPLDISSDRYEFRMDLYAIFQGTLQWKPASRLFGYIQPDDQGEGSLITGITGSKPQIWLFLLFCGLMALLALPVPLAMPDYEQNPILICISVYALLLAGVSVVWQHHQNRRLIPRLEALLSANPFANPLDIEVGAWRTDEIRLTQVERLLLGRLFIFRSDLPPQTCAERITMLMMQEEDMGHWQGLVRPLEDAAYAFELRLRRNGIFPHIARDENKTTYCHLRGVIERGDALGGSVIQGALYSSSALFVAIAFTLFMGLLFVRMLIGNATSNEWDGWILFCWGILFLFGLGVTWLSWDDRRRTLRRLEFSLQAAYHEKKPKAEAG